MNRSAFLELADESPNVFWTIFGVMVFIGGLQQHGWYMLLGIPGLLLMVAMFSDLARRIKHQT
jgi:hypothetical protein